MKKIDIDAAPVRLGTAYPPPFDAPCRERRRSKLGDAAGLTQFGVNVPENLTVVGYDDIEFSSMSSPALSTVHVPRNDSGVLAMDYLDALLRHGANAPQVPARLPTQFIFRETSRRLGSPLVAQ